MISAIAFEGFDEFSELVVGSNFALSELLSDLRLAKIGLGFQLINVHL